MTKLEKGWQGFLRVSLWLVSGGLMLASSGIDGAYLAKLMPTGWHWLGFVLNTVADVGSEIIMYWYGRLRQARRKHIWPILVGQGLLVGYAWLFGWRQLVPMVAKLEAQGAAIYAGFFAAFIPIALIVAGYVMSLLAGRVVVAKIPPSDAKEPASPPDGQQLAQAGMQTLDIPDVRLAFEAAARALATGLSPMERQERVLDMMMTHPGITQERLGQMFGVSRQTISGDQKALRQAGKFGDNGEGDNAA